MIDYEKIKTAHELAELYGKQIDDWIDVAVTLNSISKYYPLPFAFGPTGKDFDNRFTSLDELIDKLKELTQPESKFKVDDEVWIYNYYAHRIDCFVVDAIDLESLRYSGKIKGSAAEYEEIRECDIYHSREELINAQIKHWQSMKEQEEKPPIYDMKSFVSSYNQACDNFVNDILKDTGCQVVGKESDCQESIRKHHELDDGSDKVFHKPKINDEALQKFLNRAAYKQHKQNCVHLASPFAPVDGFEPCKQKCIKCGEFY